MAEFKKILLATDFSENSKWALTYALSLARRYESKLYIVHVIQQATYPFDLYAEIAFDALDKFNRNVTEAVAKEMKKFCEDGLQEFANYETMMDFKNSLIMKL